VVLIFSLPFVLQQQHGQMEVGVANGMEQQHEAHHIPAASEARTDSYGGTSSNVSSMMSVEPAGSHIVEDDKTPQDGNQMAVDASPPSPGARFVCGYEILDTLGKGMSGKVKRGRDRTTNRTVALKVIDKARTPRRVLMMLSTEIQAMKALAQHPNILSLLGYDLQAVYPRKNGGTRDVVCLALELAPGGELFDFMMYTGAFPEGEVFHCCFYPFCFC